MPFFALDRIDSKLLNLVQKNNQISTRELADKLHISQPTCLRRLRDLRTKKIIKEDVSLVDPFDLGYGLIAFLDVSLGDQAEARMNEFETRMKRRREVLQCFLVSGESDFFLIVHVADMDGYYAFLREAISGAGNIGHAELWFPISGPRGSGTVHLVGDKSAGKWEFKILEVTIDGADEEINLLEK